jgi:hypothetical protein
VPALTVAVLSPVKSGCGCCCDVDAVVELAGDIRVEFRSSFASWDSRESS